MTDTSGNTREGLNIRVPASVEQMRPPKPADIITEAANFLHAHWDEVLPFFQAISGENPSIHGSLMLDEAACVFKVQKIASENGYAMLGSVKASKLRLAVRYAYKRKSGHSVGRLEAQNRELRRIEHRRAQ